jgi:chaperonin GroES
MPPRFGLRWQAIAEQEVAAAEPRPGDDEAFFQQVYPASTSNPYDNGVQRMNVRPLHDRIIVQRLEEGEQKVGGIIIPDTAKEKPQQGKVIAVGNGKAKDDGKRIPLDVKAGDTILFGKYSGQEIKLDGEEYLIMREDEVLAVIEGAAKEDKKKK